MKTIRFYIAGLAAFAVLCLFFASCITATENLLYSAVLGYPSDEIERNMHTLDPDSSYSKRSAVAMMVLGDENKMRELESKYSGIANLVTKGDRSGVVKVSMMTEDDPFDVYITYPRDVLLSDGENYPVVLYSHGGGFENHGFSVYEKMMRRLADATGCAMVFYEYRKAPLHKFPAAVNDTYAIWQWLTDDLVPDCYRLDPKRMVFVGESSGGNLMAGLCLRLAEEGKPNANGVVLIYPSLDVSDHMNFSRIAFSGIEDPDRYYITSLKYLSHVMHTYLESKEDAYKPYASPLIMLQGLMEVEGYDNPYSQYKAKLTPPLDFLPAHFIAIAEVDTLKDEAKTYHALLSAFKAKSRLKQYSGMFHGFFITNAFIGRAKDCFDDIVAFIKETIS